MKKKIFSLFPKKLKNGTVIFYYTAYEDGKRRQFSTGKQNIDEAYKECYKRIEEGRLIVKSKYILREYTKDWFVIGKCPYYEPRIKRGKKIALSSLDTNRRILVNHITPELGEYQLQNIQVSTIENWLEDKEKSEYSNTTINKILAVLKMILKEAVRKGELKINNADKVLNYASDTKEKGIVSSDEHKALFNMDHIDLYWKGSSLHCLLNYTASVTGLRLGELLALTREKIKPNYIDVSNSYDKKYGMKSTKTNENRFVPIPPELSVELLSFAMAHGKGFIFPGKTGEKPVSHNSVNKYLNMALASLGISDNLRRERNITFHSWRHYANTKLREAGLSDPIVRSIMGHKSSKMTDHYSHIDVRDIAIKWDHVG